MRRSRDILKMLAAASETGRTEDQLAAVSGKSVASVIATCEALVRLGFAIECECRQSRRAWGITDAGRQVLADAGVMQPSTKHRSPDRGVPQTVWRALRLCRKASTTELLVLTGAAEGPALKHLRNLERAGYLTRAGDSRRDPLRDARWLLLRDTGPRTPYRTHGRKEVWDPNTGTATPMDQQEAAHV